MSLPHTFLRFCALSPLLSRPTIAATCENWDASVCDDRVDGSCKCAWDSVAGFCYKTDECDSDDLGILSGEVTPGCEDLQNEFDIAHEADSQTCTTSKDCNVVDGGCGIGMSGSCYYYVQAASYNAPLVSDIKATWSEKACCEPCAVCSCLPYAPAACIDGLCTSAPAPTTSCQCPELYDPVCGEDGITYANDCKAACELVGVAHQGECEGTSGAGDATAQPTTSPTPVPTGCSDYIPDGETKWYNSKKTKFDCDWYAKKANRCDKTGHKFENFGKTANQACCACREDLIRRLGTRGQDLEQSLSIAQVDSTPAVLV